MKPLNIMIARIYLTEKQHLLDALLSQLHDQEKVKGVTVFRGLTGFGHSGKIHSSQLLDLSFDLPIVIEFFDEPHRVNAILHHLKNTLIPSTPIVSWLAETWTED